VEYHIALLLAGLLLGCSALNTDAVYNNNSKNRRWVEIFSRYISDDVLNTRGWRHLTPGVGTTKPFVVGPDAWEGGWDMKKVRSLVHYLRSAGRFSHLIKKFLVLSETQKCITLFKTAYPLDWTLSEANSVHFKIRFNIIFSSSPRSSMWSRTFRFSELCECSFHALNACYIPHYHHPWLEHFTWGRVQIICSNVEPYAASIVLA
jgi:hypothetical protein